MICRQRLRCITCAVVALVMIPRVGFSQTRPGPTSSEWLAWKVFHESLTFYGEQSAAALDAMLSRRTGLDHAEAALLLKAGQSFVATIDSIDADAKAEVQRRYGTSSRAGARQTIRLERGKTLLEMVRESGLYDRIEKRKQAAVSAYIGQLQRAFAPAKLARVTTLVQTTVAPRIFTIDRGTPVPGVDRSASGTGGYVSRESRER
jgi:hypothetical protein